MAKPKMHDKNEMFPEVQDDTVEPKAWQFGWMWVLIALFFMAMLWYGGWGWGNHGGWWFSTRVHTAAAVAEAPPVEGAWLPILAANDKRPYIGQPFTVSNVFVESKPSNGVFWIAAKNSLLALNAPPMLVIMTGPNDTGRATGTRVSVAGTVMKAPPEAQAKKEWFLSTSGADRLEKEGVYIQATR